MVLLLCVQIFAAVYHSVNIATVHHWSLLAWTSKILLLSVLREATNPASNLAQRLYVRVCVSMSRFRNTINMRLQRYAAQHFLRTPHTWLGVWMHVTRVHIDHRCNNRMNSNSGVRCLATPLRKGSRGRKTVFIQKHSVNFNFGRPLCVIRISSYTLSYDKHTCITLLPIIDALQTLPLCILASKH